MKKLLVLAVLVAMSTGCGRGWLPTIFRGAPCGRSCGLTGNALPAPLATDAGCNNCGIAGASYGSYDSEVIGSDYYGGGVIDGSIVDGGYYGGGTIVDNGMMGQGGIINGAINSPSMAPLP